MEWHGALPLTRGGPGTNKWLVLFRSKEWAAAGCLSLLGCVHAEVVWSNRSTYCSLWSNTSEMRSEKTEAKLIIVFKTSQLKPRNEHRLIINALQHDTVMIRGCHVCWGREYARSNDWCVCVCVCVHCYDVGSKYHTRLLCCVYQRGVCIGCWWHNTMAVNLLRVSSQRH